METEAKKQVAGELMKWLQGIGDTVAEQAPLLAQDIIGFGRGFHPAAAIFSAIAAIVFFVLMSRIAKNRLEDEGGPTKHFFGVVLAAIATVGCAVAFLYNSYWAAMAWFGPRLYVVETLRDWIK